MGRKKKDATSAPTEPRKRKKAEKMPEGTFASKLRVGPITEAHMAALAALKGTTRRKVTRNHMRDHLLQACQTALSGLPTTTAVVSTTAEDDLLG